MHINYQQQTNSPLKSITTSPALATRKYIENTKKTRFLTLNRFL